jgi:GT2 family glycosyltransferase
VECTSVAVVIVTYNSGQILADCLASLTDGCDGLKLTDVVVVDNASKDDTLSVAEAARADGLPIRILPLGRNAGYAAAINAGVVSLGGNEDHPDAVLVLNPDTRLRPGCVAPLAQRLGADGCGAVAPRMVGPDGRLELSLRRKPSLAGVVGEAVLGGKLAGRLAGLGEVVHAPERYERAAPAEWAVGAVLLLSWTMLADVGGWNESFLLYSEETEFLLRAADRGWALWFEPNAVVEHQGGESTTSPMLWSLLTLNRVRLYRMRRGVAGGFVYGAVLGAGQAVRALAGSRTSRAAVATLLLRSRRLTELPG